MNCSKIFSNFAVGIGALVAIGAGLKVFIDFWGQIKKRRLLEYLRKTYPPSERGKRYNLIASSKNTDRVYLHDLLTNKKHHIASIGTYYDLYYDRSDAQIMSDDVFIQISEGEPFLTRGEFGS